jgi:hypothetical protein
MTQGLVATIRLIMTNWTVADIGQRRPSDKTALGTKRRFVTKLVSFLYPFDIARYDRPSRRLGWRQTKLEKSSAVKFNSGSSDSTVWQAEHLIPPCVS